MKIGPLFLSVNSFAASEAEVLEAGYSPPVPNPTMPREIVIIQNIPFMVIPCDAVAKIPPMTIIAVVVTIATLRPR